MPAKKVALYVRSSKDDRGKRMTIGQQKDTLRSWAEREGCLIFEEYVDDGVTGKKALAEREGGRRLVQDAKAGCFDAVAVVYIDRFGRTLLDGLMAAKALEETGVGIISVSEGIDTTHDDSPLNLHIRLMLAEEDHRRIKQRTLSAKLRSIELKGRHPGGMLPYGYRVDDDGNYIEWPEHAEAVRLCFELASKEIPNAEIVRRLNARGYRVGKWFQTRGQAPAVPEGTEPCEWDGQQVARVLERDIYWQGFTTWRGIEIPCPPLVSQEVVEQARAFREQYKRHRKYRSPKRGLVSGLLICRLCGKRFYFTPTQGQIGGGKRRTYHKYVCGSPGCHAKQLPVKELDADIWNLAVRVFTDRDNLIADLSAARGRGKGAAARLEEQEADLVRQEGELTQRVQDLWEEADANGWPIKFVAPKVNQIMQQIKEIQEQAAGIRQEMHQHAAKQEETSTIMRKLNTIQEDIRKEDLPFEKRVEYTRMIVKEGWVKTFGEGYHKQAEVKLVLAWDAEVGLGDDFHRDGILSQDTYHLIGHKVINLGEWSHKYRRLKEQNA